MASTMRLVFKYIIFSSIVLLGLSQIACPDLRVAASLAAKKARDEKAAEEKKARKAAEEEEKRKMLQPPANVSNYVLQSISNGITLTWTNPTDADFSKVLILKHTSSIVDSPTTGQNYADIDLIGGSQMMYNGNLETLTITDNTANVISYYKIFAYDTSFNYASGVELSGRRNADSDGDGLIEIYTAEMLDKIRHDLAGTSYKISASDAGNTNGCPAVVNGSGGCNGYELMADIDLLGLLDTNNNNQIDTTMEGIDKNADGDTDDIGEKVTVVDTTADTSWVPVGDNSTGDDTTRFTGIFEGNNHTIANLWVNITSSTNDIYAGLFGVIGGTVTIRNVEIISGSIHSFSSATAAESHSGGLVGYSTASLMIINSTLSGSDGISSSSPYDSYSGGLVGRSTEILTIMNSYFSGSGGVFSSSTASSAPSFSSNSSSGGLVGSAFSSLTITNCYFSGSGAIASYSVIETALAGGLVGYFSESSSSLTITNSYFGGSGWVSSSGVYSTVGSLVGRFGRDTLMITEFYWNTDAFQKITNSMTDQNPKRVHGDASSDPSGTIGLTLMQLQAITGTHPSGLPHSATDNTQAWDLGDSSELPAVKLCIPTVTGTGPTAITDWTMCASYGALLAGQR